MTHVTGSQANFYDFPPQNFAPPAAAVGSTVIVASEEGAKYVQARAQSVAARSIQLLAEVSELEQGAPASSHSGESMSVACEKVLTGNEYQQYFVDWVGAQAFYPGELEAITQGGWVAQEARAIEFAHSLEARGYPISKRAKILKNVRALFKECKEANVLPTSGLIRDLLRGERVIFSSPDRALPSSPDRPFPWRAALVGAVIGSVSYSLYTFYRSKSLG